MAPAIVCVLATGQAAASSTRVTTTSTALASTVVSGPAGAKVYLRLGRTVEMNWVGLDSIVSASRGRWEGVVVERVGDGSLAFNRDFYVDYRFTQAELCPGHSCPLPPFYDGVSGGTQHNTHRQSGGFRNGPWTFELPAGRYAVVLLGDPGARLTATLHLHGLPSGTLRMAAHERAVIDARFIHPQVTVEGHDLVSRDYLWDTGRRPRFDGEAVGFALARPATANFGFCDTAGPPDPAFCLGGGQLTYGAPPAFIYHGRYAYWTAYGADSIPNGGFGQGYDLEAVSPSSRIVVLWFSVTGF
jgi:hypothetical protein